MIFLYCAESSYDFAHDKLRGYKMQASQNQASPGSSTPNTPNNTPSAPVPDSSKSNDSSKKDQPNSSASAPTGNETAKKSANAGNTNDKGNDQEQDEIFNSSQYPDVKKLSLHGYKARSNVIGSKN